MITGGRLPVVVLVATLVGVLCVPMLARAASPSTTPPYLTPLSATFSLNDKWHGTQPVSGAPAAGWSSAPGDPGAAVWGTTCGASGQTVSFTRTVELLGPPRDGTFSWYQYVTPGTRWAGMTTLALSVNGEHLYQWARPPASSDSFTFPATAFTHFKVGANTFELKATRAALPAGSTGCNRSGQKLRISLQAKFTFDSTTDLRVGVPAQPLQVTRGVGSAGANQIITEFLLNTGPDRALDGYLLVFYGSSGAVRLQELSPSPGPCDHQGNSQWYCRFGELDPGQKLTIIMGVTYKPPAGLTNWDHEGESVLFKAFSQTPDSNSQNDSSQVNFVFCQTGSTVPDCK